MGIDILIPALGRPQNIGPLIESLKVTQTPHRVLFLCSPLDMEQIEACRRVGEVHIVDWEPGKADFAKKINLGFTLTESEWIFQGATDIRFHAGWDTMALAVSAQKRRRVIGTNDLHNPQVKRGISSTHTLFHRSYITDLGGTRDGTGLVFCEKYDHQYVDNEFCATAKLRGEWAFAKQSVVEHLHPHWGLSPDDPTYKKAMLHSMADRRLFAQRMGNSRLTERAERRRARKTRIP